jgi:hypothetical protein
MNPLVAGLLAGGSAVKVPVPSALLRRMEMVCPTGSALNPAWFPTARSGMPSLLKSAATMAVGVTNPVMVDEVGNAPVPSPKRTVTLFANWSAVAKSRAQSLLKSPTATADGPEPPVRMVGGG